METFINFMMILIPTSIILSFFLRLNFIINSISKATKTDKKEVDKLTKEFQRKTFHLIGILIPGLLFLGDKYGFLSREGVLKILGGLIAWMLMCEILRHNIEFFKNLFKKYLANVMRNHEKKKLFGTTWYLIGGFLTVYLFPQDISIAAVLYLNLGDSAASLVGMSIGKIKITEKKSLEGTLACFIMCFFLGYGVFSPSSTIWEYYAVVGALGACLAELIPNIDDNITIPLISGIALSLARYRLNYLGIN